MALKIIFKKAQTIIEKCDRSQRRLLEKRCFVIRNAERSLLEASEAMMMKCLEGCEGLCCRNVKLDTIITLWDFIYILVLEPWRKDEMAARLENEDIFFPFDCVFLREGVGPCIFSPDVRPQVCITTFCDDDAVIRKEIYRVKLAFYQLAWFIRFPGFYQWISRGRHRLKNG